MDAAAAEKLRRHLDRLPYLRGRGPLSDDYGQWVDNTHCTLIALFGEDSPEAKGFLEIMGAGAEARGLPLHTPWGMQARLERAEAYLRKLLQRLEA